MKMTISILKLCILSSISSINCRNGAAVGRAQTSIDDSKRTQQPSGERTRRQRG
jgi:hypothetical protein